MSILSRLSIVLRNFLVRQHPYFSCCASCGEIAVPLGDRLCTSLQPMFSVDVLYIARHEEALEPLRWSLRSLEVYAPWVSRVFVATALSPSWFSPRIRIVPLPDELSRLLPEEAEEHILYMPCDSILGKPGLVVDWYTPNGIPLILLPQESTGVAEEAPESPPDSLADSLRREGPHTQPELRPAYGPQALSKDSFAEFVRFLENSPLPSRNIGSAMRAYAQWAYAAQYAIPHTASGACADSRPLFAPQADAGEESGVPLFFRLADAGSPGTLAALERLFPVPSRYEMLT